jgi:type VI protein secretion system component VasK
MLLAFGALSALVGAVLAIAANGAGVPLEYLNNSPFSSFFVPGLILGVVVGGTQLAAAIALLARRGIALLLSVVAGFCMLIWIFVELAIIRQFSWLQAAYFILGGLELILTFALLGIVPARVKPLRESHATHSTTSNTRH